MLTALALATTVHTAPCAQSITIISGHKPIVGCASFAPSFAHWVIPDLTKLRRIVLASIMPTPTSTTASTVRTIRLVFAV